MLSLRTVLLLVNSLALISSQVLAQAPDLESSSAEDLWNVPETQSVFDCPPPAAPISQVPRLRLFRFAPGFLSDPLGMQEDEIELPGVPRMPSAPPGSTAETNDGPGWLQVGMGADNPYFDLRRPGDPGGFGYYRVNTQAALLDSPKTACSFGVQTVMPGGVQFAGVPKGPTVLSPAFGVFHALSDCLGLQGFVSRNFLLTNNDGGAVLQRNVQCGLALQRPLLADGPDGMRNFFFSVGALGCLSADNLSSYKLQPGYDLLPGLQWHVNDNWWLSSALFVPMGSARSAPGQWQLTCSLRF
ncbi:MAG TPA: hypothetical protein VMG10_19605 [Gemmataceae bacterium]|nr:hypothetical protein [Gemmataceae bacterium]